MTQVSNIVDTLRYGGSVDSSLVNDLQGSSPISQPSIENWQMNFEGGTLSASCQITSEEPLIGAGLLAYSADGVTFYFGSYCSMSDAKNLTTDTVAYPSASTALFDPDKYGRTIMAVVYGEVLNADGTPVPFSKQQDFTV